MNELIEWRKRRGKNRVSCICNSTSNVSVSYGPMQMKSTQMNFVVCFFITERKMVFFFLWIGIIFFYFVCTLNTSAKCGYCIFIPFLCVYCKVCTNGDLLLFVYSLVLCQFIEIFSHYFITYAVDFDFGN